MVNQVYNVVMDNTNNKINTIKYLKYESVFEQLMKLINIYSEYESSPRTYGTDEIYYSLEIHTVHIIGKNPGINVTDIACLHGISKSAVSKVLKKLEKKEVVFRYKSQNNRKEVLFKLTDKGKEAYFGHIEYHKKKEESLISLLEKIPYEKLQNFEEVLSIFVKYSEVHIKN